MMVGRSWDTETRCYKFYGASIASAPKGEGFPKYVQQLFK